MLELSGADSFMFMTGKVLASHTMRIEPSSGDGEEKDKIDDIGCASQASDSHRKRKRDALDQIGECVGNKTKQRRRKSKTLDSRVIPVDLISQLPEHIIHHILSFLRCRKDAARTSILSKRWRALWATFLILDFDQRKFQPQGIRLQGQFNENIQSLRKKKRMERKKKEAEFMKSKKMFVKFVDDTLQSRIVQKSSFQKFMLHLTSYDKEIGDHMDRWVDFITDSNIKELDLYVPFKRYRCFSLPPGVFAVKTITVLRIFGCKLGACDDIRLFNLRKLCLGKLHVDEQTLQNLIHSCPLIEDFRLINCTGFKSLLLSSNKLIRVDLNFCHRLNKAEIQAPNLQTFWHRAIKFVSCVTNLETCKYLKSLTLEDGNMEDDLFQTQLSNFPILEQLTLIKCNALERITISSHRLKTLILRECDWLQEADIDAPNLLSFEYKGGRSFSVIPFSSLKPSGLKEAKLYFEPLRVAYRQKVGFCYGNEDRIWFANLREFISKFDCSKGLKMVVRSRKNIIIHEDLRAMLLPPIYDLKVEIVKSSMSLEGLLDTVLQTWHPTMLSIVSSNVSNFPEGAYKKMLRGRLNPSCCTYNTSTNKCWRHFLKGVNRVNLDDPKNTCEWYNWLRSSASMVNHQMSCFELSWKNK